jgi:chromosome segregation ATPase
LIPGEKHVYSQIQHLEKQLSHKSTALSRALESAKNAEMSLHESIGQIRNRDEVLLAKDTDIQQLETKLVKLENEMKKERQASSHCKVLEAELASKNTELKLINQSLNDTQSGLDDAVLKTENLSREINDKNKDILDIDQKLKHALKMNMSERGFNEIISSMQAEITDMEGSLMNERQARKAAEEDSETFQIKIRSLEVQLREKMSLLLEKESDIKNLQKIVNFDQVKSSQLEELEDKMHELTHSLNIEIQANRMAKRELEKKDIKIQSIEFTLQSKDKSIQDLEDIVKTHNVSEMSDRIMNSTIQQLETQLQERDGLLAARNDKIKVLDRTLQDSLGRVRELETEGKEQDSEFQNLAFKKQNADREAIKLKTTCQSLEGKLALFEKQNETMESRTKLLIFEKHEAVNKLEMLEKIVQDMAESTIDTAASVKEQKRLTEELSNANFQMATLASDLEKSNVTIAVLRNSLLTSDEEIKRLASQSHATFVAKKAVNAMVSNYKESKEQKKRDLAVSTDIPIPELETVEQAPFLRTFERSDSVTPPPALQKAPSSRKVITPARSLSFADGLKEEGGSDSPPVSFPITPRTMKKTLLDLENNNGGGIIGKKHEKTSTLAEITDFINSTARDIEKISGKKKAVRASIEKFTEEFKEKNNRQPTPEEKSNAPDNIFTNYQQLSHILKKKTAKLAEAEEQFRHAQSQTM